MFPEGDIFDRLCNEIRPNEEELPVTDFFGPQFKGFIHGCSHKYVQFHKKSHKSSLKYFFVILSAMSCGHCQCYFAALIAVVSTLQPWSAVVRSLQP